MLLVTMVLRVFVVFLPLMMLGLVVLLMGVLMGMLVMHLLPFMVFLLQNH
jgi:hypothetical protein